MVGIGGRSKGCKTCRRRRVKCDQAKPSCERCRKAGFRCEGYVQFGEFVDLTDKLIEKGSSKHSQSPEQTSAAITNLNSPASNDAIIKQPLMPLTPNPMWDEQQVFTSYLVDRLFTWHENPSSPESAAWINVLLQSNQDDGALPFASIRALSTSYFAKRHRQSHLMRKATGFYSRALSTLRSQLQDPILVLRDDVLVAIITLAIYELITFSQPRGWLEHYKGLASLTVMRGPHRHQSGVGFSMLATLRSCILMGYLVERKHCFLESFEWRTIPWEIVGPDAKLPLDKLHDILCDVPGHLEEIDLIKKCSQEDPEKDKLLAEFRKKASASLENLYTWRWDWEINFPASAHPIPPNGLDPETSLPIPPSPFQSVVWFVDPYRANELMTYNSIRMILKWLLEQVGVFEENLSTFDVSDPLLPMEGTRHDIAIELCRMVEYHLHSFRRSSGAFMLIFPMNVAYIHLDGNRDGAKSWLESVMALVADIHGFEVGRHENMPRQVNSVSFTPEGSKINIGYCL